MTEQAEILEPNAAPKMPRGVALMLKNILGIDPVTVMKQFDDTFKLMVGFCKHADGRMSAMAQELRATREEVAALRAMLENKQPQETRK